MESFAIISLQWLFRIFGAFWIFGGILAFQEARQAYFMDNALEALTSEKEDRLVSFFLFITSVLTILSGAGLLLTRRWVFVPLVLLILAQIVYFAIQQKRFRRATTDEERNEARISSATMNAFKVCLGVAIAAALGWIVGALK